jgi:photosystem II stability/assembly factor-like uncharacterized protein
VNRSPFTMRRVVFVASWLVLAATFLASVLSLRAAQTYADSGPLSWQVESQLPFINPINDVAFSSSLLGTAVGDNGSIWQTRDGGITWAYLAAYGLDDLKHIVFSDPSRGYIAGDHSLLHSHDDGLSWNPVLVPWASDEILDISAPADGSLFVLTTLPHSTGAAPDRAVFASDDGGVSWRFLNAALGLTTIAFTDKAHGWLTGSDGMLRTQDGGLTWTTVDLHESFYPAINFVDQNNGWLVAQNFQTRAVDLYKTTDGGSSWQNLNFGQASYVGFLSASIAALSPSAVSFSLEGTAYASTDGGATLVQQALPLDVYPRQAIVTGFRASDPYILANTYTEGYVFLHLGQAPVAPTSTPSASPTPSAAVIPSSTATVSGTVAVPTIAVQTAQGASIVPLPALSPIATSISNATTVSGTALPVSEAALPPATVTLGIANLEPSTIIAGATTSVLLHGSGFDRRATVIIGGQTILPSGAQAPDTLRLAVPAGLAPGTYAVRVVLASGAATSLDGALAVLPKLQLGAQLSPATVHGGSTTTVLVKTLTAATLTVHATHTDGSATRDVLPSTIRGAGDQWTVRLKAAEGAAPGSVLVHVDARFGAQHAQRVLQLRIIGVAPGR